MDITKKDIKTRNKMLRGVNIGGWLVVEKWMTPSLFANSNTTDEYTLSAADIGRERLNNHHQTFITEADFRWLAANKIEIIRIPFGHWIFGDAEPYVGSIERLDWAVQMATKYNIRVLLDLHAAPGAQNDEHHSGSGQPGKGQRWLKDAEDQQKTIDVLVRIAERYKHESIIWGIQMLNEPSLGKYGLRLTWFYRRAYKALTEAARPGTHIVFSDAYAPLLLTNALWLSKRRDFPIVMDCHFYQCFGEENADRTIESHIEQAEKRRWLVRFFSWQQPIIVGEWSTVLQIDPGTDKTLSYAKAQLRGFTPAEAEFYWNYKTEGTGRWNYRAQVETGAVRITHT